MSSIRILDGKATRPYLFSFAEYDRERERYFLNQKDAAKRGIINVEIDDPLASWGEIYELVDELKDYGFDHRVDGIQIDDFNSIFLRDHYGRLIGVDVSEWDRIEKHIFDTVDIRDMIDLPCHVQMKDTFFFAFTDNDDDEDGIFEWGVFYPAQ